MPEHVTTLPIRVTSSTPDIRGAHAHLIERLAAVPPNVINPFLQADEDDLILRAETLRTHLRAMAQYAVAFVRDTAAHTYTIHTDRLYLDGRFDDIIGDLCGSIENAAETLQEERANRAA